MVDQNARLEAAQALRRFLNCQTTNHDYESEYPLAELFGRKRSKDPAIQSVYELSWYWFDDLVTHKLEGRYELSREMHEVGERCLLFFHTSLEYEWRETRFIGSDVQPSNLITLGLADNHLTIAEQLSAHLNQPEGDASVWPFFRREDYGTHTR
jgi:hypothetical protein